MSRMRRELGLLLAIMAAGALVWLLFALLTQGPDVPAAESGRTQATEAPTESPVVDAGQEAAAASTTIPLMGSTGTTTSTVEVGSDSSERPAAKPGEKRLVSPTAAAVWGLVRNRKQEPVNLADETRTPARIFARNEAGERVHLASFLSDSQYGIDGIAPGNWTITADVAGHFPWSQEIHLTSTELPRRVDIELEAYPILQVRIEIDLGEAPSDVGVAMRRMGDTGMFWGYQVIRPVLTMEPPPDLLPNVNGFGDSGDGILHGGSSFEADRWIEKTEFEIRHRLPVHVSAAVGDRVLRTVKVLPGDDEVVFAFPMQEIDDRMAILRFSVTDENGGPPPAPVVCHLWRDPEVYGYGDLPPSNDGVILIERVLPGPLGLEIKVPGFTRHQVEFRMEPGMDKDLGEIRLQPERVIRGWVLNPDGTRARATVECFPLSKRPGAGSMIRQCEPEETGPQGSFEFSGLGRGDYIVRARGGPPFDLASGSLRLSTQGESIDDLEVRLHPTTTVEIQLERSASGRCWVFVDDEASLPAGEQWLSTDDSAAFGLFPGRYSARAVVRGEVIATTEFEAAGQWNRVVMEAR